MKKLIVILAAIAMVGAFAVTTMAAEWNFYGSARMATFWTSDSYTGQEDVDDFTHTLQGNARLGATVKTNDEIGGGFEYGSGPNLRKLYGTYNFGSGQILVGQTYVPSSSYFYSNSVFDGDGDLLGVGQFYTGRIPMIQLKMAGLKVALIDPNTGATLGGTSEAQLPKVELSYGFKTDAFFVDAFAGYQTFEEKGTAIGDQDVDSWVVGIGGGATFGPVYFKAGVHMSQNQGQYGAYNPADMSDEAFISGTELVDVDGMGYLAVLGFKAGDKLTFEIGYGYEENEADVSGAEADETVQYYGNCTYVITPGFFIVPEIGLIDRDDDANQPVDEDETLYYGLKTQINF